MAGSSIIGILLTGVHGSRPSSGLAYGTLYSCSTHSLIYQTTDSGSTWVTWADMSGSGAVAPTTLTIPGAASPAQTAEGSAVWDTDDDILTIGDGASRKTLENRVTTTRGDIIVRGASINGRLAVGSANRLLRSDGTDPSWGQVVEADLNLTDVTTANVSTSAHGFVRKLDNNAAHFLAGDGTWGTPSGSGADLAGKELDFAEITSAVNITGTTEAAATTIVTGNTFTPDGSTVIEIEFYTPFITLADNTNTRFWLYDAAGGGAAASIGEIARFTTTVIGSPTLQFPMTMKRRLTPSNAAHIYGIRASSSSGTGNVQAGAGGNAAVVPAYLRITRVSS